MGITPLRRRTADSRGSVSLVLAGEDAERVRRARREDYPVDGAAGRCLPSDVGVFYIIRLVPELDPGRLKFGFANSLASRLADHRVTSPTLEVVKTWPARFTWERAAIECLSVHCRQIGGEVYQANDVEAVVSRADQFFALLPSLVKPAE
jgi:hypothetical protein